MRRGLLAAAAALVLLPGCHELWGESSGASDYTATSVREDTSTSVDPTADDLNARANVRAVVVPIEAWYAEHQTYAGLTLEKLRKIDPLLEDIQLVGALTTETYCVESSVGDATWRKQGPGSPLTGGHCPDTVVVPPPPSSDPQANLRAVIPAIEAWGIEHGTYAGATIEKLRVQYDSNIPTGIVLVVATKKSYCVESTGGGKIWSYHGPRPGFSKGGC
jgi:hypothetical protein